MGGRAGGRRAGIRSAASKWRRWFAPTGDAGTVVQEEEEITLLSLIHLWGWAKGCILRLCVLPLRVLFGACATSVAAHVCAYSRCLAATGQPLDHQPVTYPHRTRIHRGRIRPRQSPFMWDRTRCRETWLEMKAVCERPRHGPVANREQRNTVFDIAMEVGRGLAFTLLLFLNPCVGFFYNSLL